MLELGLRESEQAKITSSHKEAKAVMLNGIQNDMEFEDEKKREERELKDRLASD